IAARTLLQHAVPTTFGLKAAGWLDAVLDARTRLRELRDRGLAAQLGGAAGTLSALGGRALDVVGLYARGLHLREPQLPWHSNRVRVAELGSALEVAGGVGRVVRRTRHGGRRRVSARRLAREPRSPRREDAREPRSDARWDRRRAGRGPPHRAARPQARARTRSRGVVARRGSRYVAR